MAVKHPSEDSIAHAKDWIAKTDFILLTAGAGLTAAAGVNYADTKLFAREFPAMLQYGFTAQYQFIGFDGWEPDLQWGYWAAHVDLVRFRWPKSRVYQDLNNLAKRVGADNIFIMTSNVDAMFERNGFDSKQIYTPQGDYALLQCTTPCTRAIWPWKEKIDQIRAATDPETQRLTDPELIPHCPNCGETVFPNVRIDHSFIHDHFEPAARRLQSWTAKAQTGKGVVIEVGAGFNTPSVIRWPGERLVELAPKWKLVRINLTDASVPEQLANRAVSLKGDARSIIKSILGSIL